MDTPQREPPACSRTKGTLIVPFVCHSQRGWFILGRHSCVNKAGITHLSRAGYIPKLSFSDHQFCEHCQYGKQVSASHPTSALRDLSPLDLVHSDVCGPMRHPSLRGASYFVSFIDDSTQKVWLTLSERKIGCSRSSPIGSQWSKIKPVGN